MSLFQIAKDRLIAEIRRLRNKDFLEAAMAAGALMASADNEVLISERFALDYVLANVSELKIFDVHEAVDRFRDYVDALNDDYDAGKEKILKIVSGFSEDEHAAGLLVRACMLIAKADGTVNDSEMAILSELCRVLNLDPSQLDLLRPGSQLTEG